MSIQHRLSLFTTWFTLHGGLIHPSTELVHSPAQGVHLRRRKPAASDNFDLHPGEIVIQCPHSLTLSALDVWGVSIPERPPSIDGFVSNERDANEARTEKLALPPELVASAPRPQSLAAVFLCLQVAMGRESRWKPYLDCLPGLPAELVEREEDKKDERWLGIGEVESPVWWSGEERSWVQGTPLERGLEMLEGLWRVEWEDWGREVGRWAEGIGEGRGERWVLDWNSYKHALTLLTSRAFSSDQLKHVPTPSPTNRDPSSSSSLDHPDTSPPQQNPALLSLHNPDILLYPGMDMLNHSPTTANRWRYDANSFSIVCNDVVEPGGQVWNTYGAKNNGQLLLSYGFAIPDNPHDAFPLRLPPLAYPPSHEDQHEPRSQIQSHQHKPDPDPEHDHERDTKTSSPSPSTTTTKDFTANEPTIQPPAHDSTLTTFYIRHPPIHGSYAAPIPGYASSTGIPTSLTARLNHQLANPRERYLARVAGTSSPSNSASTPKPKRKRTFLPTNRNKLATLSLLHSRLLHEQRRLRLQAAKLDTVSITINQQAARALQRLDAARTYLRGQVGSVDANVVVLGNEVRRAVLEGREGRERRDGGRTVTLETVLGDLRDWRWGMRCDEGNDGRAAGDGEVWRQFVEGVLFTCGSDELDGEDDEDDPFSFDEQQQQSITTTTTNPSSPPKATTSPGTRSTMSRNHKNQQEKERKGKQKEKISPSYLINAFRARDEEETLWTLCLGLLLQVVSRFNPDSQYKSESESNSASTVSHVREWLLKVRSEYEAMDRFGSDDTRVRVRHREDADADANGERGNMSELDEDEEEEEEEGKGGGGGGGGGGGARATKQEDSQETTERIQDLLHVTHVAHLHSLQQEEHLQRRGSDVGNDDSKIDTEKTDQRKSIWAPQHWTGEILGVVVRVVEEESVVIDVDGYVGAGLEAERRGRTERCVVFVVDD